MTRKVDEQCPRDTGARPGGAPGPGLESEHRGLAPGSVLRRTRALAHDTERPPIDPDRAVAEYAQLYARLRADDELAAVCGFTSSDLTSFSESMRIATVRGEIGSRGSTFTVLPNEMAYFVRQAWMSADRCSGRQYSTLPAEVRYLPGAQTAPELLRAAVDHAHAAMQGGAVTQHPQTVVTILGPAQAPGQAGGMFLTEQLVRFAGYRLPEGTWLGDGGYRELTEWVQHTLPGVLPAVPSPFDVLPMVAVGTDGEVAAGVVPADARYLVDLPWPQHPDRADGEGEPGPAGTPATWFGCWTALPLQTNFALDVAGQRHTMIFNGWYVDEEIAVNLLDPERYAWAERISAVIHGGEERERLRRTDRLDEYRMAQVEIATLRAIRAGFQRARRKLDKLGPSQSGFARFRERYVQAHGEEPPNDPGWTANRLGSRFRQPSHPMPAVPQTRGARLVKLWTTYRSLTPDAALTVVDLARSPIPS